MASVSSLGIWAKLCNTSSRAKFSTSVLQSMENKKRARFAGYHPTATSAPTAEAWFANNCPEQKPEGQIYQVLCAAYAV